MNSETLDEQVAEDRPSLDVLIAEDNRLQARILQDRLTKAGFDVRVAQDGALALDMARDQRTT